MLLRCPVQEERMPSPITALEEEDAGDSVSQMIDNAIGVRLKRETERERDAFCLPRLRVDSHCVACTACSAAIRPKLKRRLSPTILRVTRCVGTCTRTPLDIHIPPAA
jgi:hypothetical protein